MPFHFFAMLSRMKYIIRWGLMRNTRPENLSEHSMETAMIAHALAVIANRRFQKAVDANRVGMAALFHDASEILTGDLPTPVKYDNREISQAYKEIEQTAAGKLLNMLPADLAKDYHPLLYTGLCDEEKRMVKAADRLSALIKCMEEERQGNGEFKNATVHVRRKLEEMALPEVEYFMSEFLGGYELTLDEMSEDHNEFPHGSS